MKNMSVCQEGRKSFLVSVVGELFRKGIAAALAACAIPAANAVEMSVVNVGGVPRFAIDGKPVAVNLISVTDNTVTCYIFQYAYLIGTASRRQREHFITAL